MTPLPADHSVLVPQPSPPTSGNDTDVRREPRTGLVEVIDLHTAEPAELERLLQQWRATALAAEHLSRAEVAHDSADRGHLVLQIEYDLTSTASGPGAPTSPEAGLVAALLDRPPRFRA